MGGYGEITCLRQGVGFTPLMLNNGSTRGLSINTTANNGQLQISNSLQNRKIILFEAAVNDHDYYGFGVNSFVLRYQVPIGASHVFYSSSSTTASTELMRISSNGNIGIGSSNPQSTLVVAKPLAASAPITVETSYYIGVGDQEYRTGSYRLIGFGFKSASSYPAYIGFYEDLQSSMSYGSLVFGTRSVTTNTTPTERMRISPTGYVGIGTTGPSCELDVNGVARAGRGLIVGNSVNMSRKYYSQYVGYTKTSTPLQITLTFGNSSFSTNMTCMLTNTGSVQDLSVAKLEAIGGTSNNSTPTMNILSTQYSVSTITGTSWTSSATTTPTTIVLTAAANTNGNATYNLHIELVGGSLLSITDNDTTPNTITFTY